MKRFFSFTVASALLCCLVDAFPAPAVSAGQVGTPTKPEHTDPKEAPDCDYWYIADPDGDTCFTISQKSGVSLTIIFKLNPALKTDCFGANPGWGYCTHVPDAAGTTTTTTSFSSIVSTTTTQKPTTTSTTTKLTTVTTTTKTTTTITKATTTTTTSKTTTTSALPDPTFLPDQFPPKKGQAAQCVPEFPDDRFPNGNLQPYMIWGDELTEGVQQACTKLLPGGSKWLEKGDPYTVTVPVLRRTMYFHLKIWLGAFTVTKDDCVKQINSVFSHCYLGSPPGSDAFGGTVGGCGYTDDLNLQACFFPTRICDPSFPPGACDE